MPEKDLNRKITTYFGESIREYTCETKNCFILKINPSKVIICKDISYSQKELK